MAVLQRIAVGEPEAAGKEYAFSRRQAVDLGVEEPPVLDAWIDESKTKVGYEIPLNRHFYRYAPPRRLEVIEADIRNLESEIMALLGEVTA